MNDDRRCNQCRPCQRYYRAEKAVDSTSREFVVPTELRSEVKVGAKCAERATEEIDIRLDANQAFLIRCTVFFGTGNS